MGTFLIALLVWIVISITAYTLVRVIAFLKKERAGKAAENRVKDKSDYFDFINRLNLEYYSRIEVDRHEAEARSKDLIRRSLELVKRREAERGF